MRLSRALRVSRGDVVALVGAGGKSTALFRLAEELSAAGWRVAITTTTHLAVDQLALAPAVLRATDPGWEIELEPMLNRHGRVLVITGAADEPGKVRGLLAEDCARLARHPAVDVLLVEADGARRRLLKAPAPHEPVIPPEATLVVIVAGLSAIGHPLSARAVHRPERFAALSGLTVGSSITPDAVARVILHPEGGLRRIPAGARAVALLTRADTPERLAYGRAVARQVLSRPGIDEVLLAELTAGEPVIEAHGRVAGIVLAAGGSTRFGRPKLLLPWGQTTLIEHVLARSQAIGLDQLLVVVGAAAEQIKKGVANRAKIVYNVDWVAGQSSSLRAGLQALPSCIAATLFILADQPDLQPGVVQALITRWRSTRAPIVVPRYRGQRGNPVLFDRTTFPELMALQGDIGGRALITRYGEQVAWVDVDAPLPFDIDTPEAYQRAKRKSATAVEK